MPQEGLNKGSSGDMLEKGGMVCSKKPPKFVVVPALSPDSAGTTWAPCPFSTSLPNKTQAEPYFSEGLKENSLQLCSPISHM